MKRRRLLMAGAACYCCAPLHGAWGQIDYTVPERLGRPGIDGDEGGLWAMMDREERNLRRSPFLVRDAELKSYLEGIACRLAGDHCPDVRVYLVRTPMFNANMAPNGMMQIWTGLLLRVDNEAQLAAVIGHEIGHYLQRHSLSLLRDAKSKSSFGQFLGAFGLVGSLAQLAILASMFSYGRDHEREADRIGALLMHRAGYDVGEAPKVWSNLLEEVKAREGKEPGRGSPMFATHPSPPERRETLEQYASGLPGGEKGEAEFARHIDRFLDEWLQDEVKRGQHDESLALLTRMLNRQDAAAQERAGLVLCHRGEVHRLRGGEEDFDRALEDYRAASAGPQPPAAAFRGMGLVARRRGESAQAREAFSRYLELAPDAPDALLIKSYIMELGA